MQSKQQKHNQQQLIYLDYAATTPVDPRVVSEMQPYWNKIYGNPSSIYQLGKQAGESIIAARSKIAKLIYAKPTEIIFTAGGTESINLAILGFAKNFLTMKTKKGIPPHFITSKVEHHAVLSCFNELESLGFKVTRIPVNSEGVIDAKNVIKAIKPETVFVSIMYANNEIGSIQPIQAIAREIKKINSSKRLPTKSYKLQPIVFHTDACQATGYLDMNVHKLGVDLMSVNGSKIYGPKQTGFLYARTGTKLKPIILGGGQENDLRSGTENVPGIVGLAKAFELIEANKEKEGKRIRILRNYLAERILKKVQGIKLNGSSLQKYNSRLPNNLNFTVKDVEGEILVLYLDAKGIEVSTGSACTSETEDPSHVLLSIGRTKEEAKNSIRMTLGKYTTKQELDKVIKILPETISQLRKIKS